MDIVIALFEHSKIQITQKYYRKIVQKRVSLEMKRLKGSA